MSKIALDSVASLIIDGKLGEGDVVRVDVGADDRLFAARDDAASERRRSGTVEPSEDEPLEPDALE